ncbi:hypothetical protein TWF718_000942 [Orbilia javanica]|uniref:Uncharacterized protein n=1 Tax=Orbilia javanica TaxID=47235 RepID=A0AAN8RGD1_9PEZI
MADRKENLNAVHFLKTLINEINFKFIIILFLFHNQFLTMLLFKSSILCIN